MSRSPITYALLIALLVSYSSAISPLEGLFTRDTPEVDLQEGFLSNREILDIATEEFEQAGAYNETFRGQFHWSPEKNWGGYPSGLVLVEKTYHMFMQISPCCENTTFLSWGHATSSDLITWKYEGDAISYQNITDGQLWVLSGSSVYDSANTSGFGKNAIVSIYTGQGLFGDPSQDYEAQMLAYSTDNGATFKTLDQPVLSKDSNSFRGPHVAWDEDYNQWVMVVAESANNTIDVYTSKNLQDWTFQSSFGPAGFHQDCQWEAPQLMKLNVNGVKGEDQWVLMVSVLGGNSSIEYNMFVQYFLVKFDGKLITNQNSDDVVLKVDEGFDFYQANVYTDGLVDPIMVAWMDNLNYAGDVPTDGWKGQMTIPRKLTLNKVGSNQFALNQAPVEALQKLRNGPLVAQSDIFVDAESASAVEYHAKVFELVIKYRIVTAEEVGVRVYSSGDGKQETIIGYNKGSKKVFIDRSKSGKIPSDKFAPKIEAPYTLHGESIEFRIFVDRGSVEVFIDGGALTMTSQIFPDNTKDAVSVYAPKGLYYIDELRLWNLNSIWSSTDVAEIEE